MITELYGWVRNITCYLIFMTVITNILPNKKYEKYVRLFAGMVLILIVLKPLTSGLRLDDQIAYFFESITFQSQAGDFKRELAGMEEQRLGSMVEQYERAVQMDVEKMAEGEELHAKRVRAVIDRDQNSGRFGAVTSISVVLGVGDTGEETAGVRLEMEPVEPIKPVKIGSGEGTVQTGESGAEGAAQTGENGPEGAAQSGESGSVGAAQPGQAGGESLSGAAGRNRAEENAAVRAFRQKLTQYYNLEAQDVEIQLEDG